MADTAALQALQDRLRQQWAHAEDGATPTMPHAQWLAVRMGASHYLLALELAGEIAAWQGVAPVPYTQPWFWGVANLRGQLLGVVDVPGVLGQQAVRTDSAMAQISLLTLHAGLQVQAALVIDRLLGLRQREELQPLDEAEAVDAGSEIATQATAAGVLGARYTDAHGQTWQELHLHALAQWPRFVQVALPSA